MLKTVNRSFAPFSYENLYFLVCIFYSSRSISFYSSPLGYIFLFIVSSLFLLKYNPSQKLGIALTVWILYCLSLILVYGDMELTFNHFIRYSTLILASYILIKIYGIALFVRFEQMLIFLAKVSLFFWLWSIINFSSLIKFASIFNIGSSGNNPDRIGAFYYIVVYTVERLISEDYFIPRNYGFCLEPVIFACFLVLTLYFNIMRNGGIKLKQNRGFWILLITLFTTQSTTGILAFMIFVVYYILSNRRIGIKKYFYLASIIAVFSIAIINFDFLLPKLVRGYESLSDFERISKMSSPNMRFSAGRFGGLIIGWKDILAHPILGIGANGMRSIANKGGASLMNTNGFAGIMSVFGLFGVFIYFYLATKSSFSISRVYNNRFPLGFLITFTILLNGAGVYTSVVFFSLLIFGYFNQNRDIYYEKPKSSLTR